MLTKTRRLYELHAENDEFVTFSAEDHHPVILERFDWEDMGSPLAITITIEPGDLLNQDE